MAHVDEPGGESASPQTAGAPRLPRRPPFWSELCGWYGTLAILGAYAALSFGWLERGPAYQLLNLTGALGVASICWYRRTWQALTLETIWALIAVTALLGLGSPA